ncbi:BfmA/BtgA family mobilization protein [Dysgonomonas sp. GY617]|uniref:BfmA/BtgA family mobilization protein n=1 Tax=Dysgonomonas sp. GY617 TaxID=2780420 RepID=UPI001883F425|nr:BfmA/BtgA family mobilization protein [Dysgonomonas sp. GY617]MBF0577575.1 clindamycin resistance transfer factor BtgA [Dysgonomonas sp. GY617]
MQNQDRKIIYTTVSIDKETGRLIDKICKRYSLKKSEVVKLVFRYIDKAHINPADAPESVKSELSKINKRQDDIIRFIRHYEEEQLNPMIRTSNSIAVKFDAVAKTISERLDSEIANSKDTLVNVLRKLDEQFGKIADVVTNHSKIINSLSQAGQRDNKKILKLIALYADLAACGVMDSKRKENLRSEIIDLINETQ